MSKLSIKFKTKLKMTREPAYRLAWRAGMHPSTLSRLLHGATSVEPDDKRLIAIGKELGLSAQECFSAGSEADDWE